MRSDRFGSGGDGTEVVDLAEDTEQLYFVCLEDWSPETKDMGHLKEAWYRANKDKGLRVKLAKDDRGVVGGMIQYIPIEQSSAEGSGLYFVSCIHVHGHKQGRGDFRGKGMGKALLKAAEDDARSLGADGMVVWGLSIPAFMRASWFKRQGYKKVDKDGVAVLLWKPFSTEARPPRWVRKKKSPGKVPGKVSVDSFVNGWCPGQNMVYERAKRAASEFGDKVVFNEHDTAQRNVFDEWGMGDALFIDGKAVWTGPPPSYEKIRKLMAKRVRKL